MTQNKLDLIIKLQRLTQSDNENESKAAERKLKKLLEETGFKNIDLEEEWKREICTVISDFDGTKHIDRILSVIEGHENPDNYWYAAGYIIGVAEAMRRIFPENHVMCGKYLRKYQQNPYNPEDHDYQNETDKISEEDMDAYIDGNVDGYDNTLYLWVDEDGYMIDDE